MRGKEREIERQREREGKRERESYTDEGWADFISCRGKRLSEVKVRSLFLGRVQGRVGWSEGHDRAMASFIRDGISSTSLHRNEEHLRIEFTTCFSQINRSLISHFKSIFLSIDPEGANVINQTAGKFKQGNCRAESFIEFSVETQSSANAHKSM